MDDRVIVVALLWFAAFTFGGDEIGRWVFATPGTGATVGFFLALVSLLTWPFILPSALQHWMHDQY
jgi:hypothetical protein